MSAVDVMRADVGDETGAAAEPSALPHGWTFVPISEVARLRSDKADPRIDVELPFVGMDDIQTNGLKIKQTRPFSELKSLGNRFRAGDMLYGRLRPYLNKTAVANVDGASSGELLVIEPTTAIDVRYLQFFMHSRRFVSWVSSVTSGDRPRISFELASSFSIPLAPITEQQRIVARIDALFAEIDEGEAALASARKGLETFRRALLKSAVTGALTKDWRATNPPTETADDLLARIARERAGVATTASRARRATEAAEIDLANLPDIPDGWAWATIRGIANVIGGLTKNPAREKMQSRAPYLRVANVQKGALDLTYIKEIGVTAEDLQRSALEAGDLLVVEGNGSIDQIGRCAIWNGEIVGCVHQNHIIKVRFKDSQLSNWCLTWLLSPHGRHEIEQVAASTSGLHTLSISKVETLPIPIPPPAEVTEILRRVADAISAMDDTQTILDTEASDAARLKQSILKSAFKGRLVPQDPADEPASAMLARLTSGVLVPPTRKARRQKQKT